MYQLWLWFASSARWGENYNQFSLVTLIFILVRLKATPREFWRYLPSSCESTMSASLDFFPWCSAWQLRKNPLVLPHLYTQGIKRDIILYFIELNFRPCPKLVMVIISGVNFQPQRFSPPSSTMKSILLQNFLFMVYTKLTLREGEHTKMNTILVMIL